MLTGSAEPGELIGASLLGHGHFFIGRAAHLIARSPLVSRKAWWGAVSPPSATSPRVAIVLALDVAC
jgi:hypothetical protein